MRKFKDFVPASLLTEMPHLIDDYDKEENKLPSGAKVSRKNGKHVSNLSSSGSKEPEYTKLSSNKTHHFMMHKGIDLRGKAKASFIAVHKKTGDIHMKVSGDYHEKSGSFHVASLSGHEKSGIRAHEFYHHLVTNDHIKELHSDSVQSEGGKKVWQRFAKMKGVKVSGSDGKIHPVWNKNYSTDAEYAKASDRVNKPGERLDSKKYESSPRYKALRRRDNRTFIATKDDG